MVNMNELKFSARFLDFLGDYARSTGKDPVRIVEEAVGQAIVRHSGHDEPSPVDRQILLAPRARRLLLDLLLDFDPKTETDSPFGVLLERLPDRNWTYQIAQLDGCWFMVISEVPRDLPEPIELKSVETSQAYCWIFGHNKSVKLWSSQDRFLVIF